MNSIIIMAKVPLAGNVKTRLQTILSPAQCAAFAGCLLRDTVKKTETLPHQAIIAYTPPEKRDFFDGICGQSTIFVEQSGADLGERMFNAFRFAFQRKFDSVVMIGTDSPTFPAGFIEQAFEFLETDAEIVLGKTSDGGFYLIALRDAAKKEIFEAVEWSSEKTFAQVCRNIKNLNLNLREIPEWYDIDEENDLNQLKEEFSRDENAKIRAPHTFNWIRLSGKKETETTK
jgi:rSAM/selenodomain-associated transferase 1